MSAKEPRIQILISCHKDVLTPQSPLFIPVEVGAAQHTNAIAGFQPDNQGENISERNFTFCELTAQYWAWKNLEADYYGLCHYRRYFCFDGQDHAANDHGQIEVESLSEFSLRDYRIADEQLIRAALADCDVIVPPYWDVKQAPTPCGPQKTIQAHMVSYGLYTDDEAALVRSIIAERQPEYLGAYDAYMGGNKYLGYSCYVMNKSLFQRFCEFEFDVLLEFDKRCNYEGMTTTHKRLCGYFGEVLYSTFIGKLRQEGAARIKECPLVFFDDTSCKGEPLVSVGNPKSDAAQPVRIFWRYSNASAVALTVCLENLFSKLAAGTQYQINVLYSNNFQLAEFNSVNLEIPGNVNLQLTNWSNMPLGKQGAAVSLQDLDIAQPLLLPWLFDALGRYVWIGGLAVFNDDPAKLLASVQDKPFAALRNALLQRELNKPASKGLLASYALNPVTDEILDTTFMVVDSASARQFLTVDALVSAVADVRRSLADIAYESEVGKPLSVKKEQVDNPGYSLGNQAFRAQLLIRVGAQALDFVAVSYSLNVIDTTTWLSEDWAKQWRAAASPVAVYLEAAKAPVLDVNQRFANLYWQSARNSAVYEIALAEALRPQGKSLKQRLFPRGSKRRAFAVRIARLLGR